MPSNQEFFDAIKNISVDADTLNLNTDQLEGKLDTTTGLLTTLSADTAIIKNDLANGVLSDVRDGAGNALTSATRGSQRALSVQVVDGSGNQVTSFGGTFTGGSINATQSTASSLKAQAQLLNAAGTVVEYATTGSAGTPATDVVSVQGVAGGTAIPVSLASVPSHPVTGTFWPATQPVSGSVSVSNFPATQPVSLASVPSHPVTGTFWQAIQPVSGTVTANTGLTQPLTDTQLRAASVPVNLPSSSTASISTFTQTSSSTVLSASATRKGVILYSFNAGSSFVSLGDSATTTSNYSFVLGQNDIVSITGYTGIITGIVNGSANLRVTSLS